MTDLPPPGGEPGQPGWAAPTPSWGAPPPAPPPAASPPSHPQATPAYGPQAYLPQGAPVGWGPPPPRVQPLGGLRTALVPLLAGSGVVALVTAAVLLHRASLVDDFTGGARNLSEVSDADSAVGGAIAIFILAVITTAVVWIIWQARHSANAGLLGRRGGLGVGWAIGGWFIPVANFVLPVVELHQSSKASDPAVDPSLGNGSADSTIVPWGVVWGLGWVLFWAGRASRPNDDQLAVSEHALSDFASADRISAIAALVLTAAAVFAILVVLRLTRRQQEQAELRPPSAGPTPPAAPAQWGQPPPGWAPPPTFAAPPPYFAPPPAPPPPSAPPPSA